MARTPFCSKVLFFGEVMAGEFISPVIFTEEAAGRIAAGGNEDSGGRVKLRTTCTKPRRAAGDSIVLWRMMVSKRSFIS
jgi:hypothetical protein